MDGQVGGCFLCHEASGRTGLLDRRVEFDCSSPGDLGLQMRASRPWPRRMLRRLVRILLLGAVVLGLGWMLGRGRGPLDRAPGRAVGDFALEEVSTRRLYRLSEHRGRVVVIVFIGTDCPIGGLYMPRLTALATAYGGRDVDFVV